MPSKEELVDVIDGLIAAEQVNLMLLFSSSKAWRGQDRGQSELRELVKGGVLQRLPHFA